MGVASIVKRAFKFRFYPDPEQADLLNRTFGCVRKVYNLALQARTEGWHQRQERVNYNATSAMLTAWKRTDELAFLNEVSVANPRHERAERARLAHAQRALARKDNGSKNRAKARLTVARVHARIADRRRDHLHKLTTRLVRENQTLVIDRWYPSSKLCSACGAIAEKMPLNVRKWTCRCGTAHDRDVNAARNILAAGLAVSACGAGVRPQRGNLRSGQQAVKQETRRSPAGIPVLQL